MTTTYAITGANRGLGLQFVRQLSSDPSNVVIAAVRSLHGNLSDLQKLAHGSSQIHILECDTSDLESISKFGAELSKKLGKGAQLHYLLNNAGINGVPDQTSLTINAADLRHHIDVNVSGPAMTLQAVLPLLKRGSVVMNMTSGLGSCGTGTVTATAYSISKAALNMLTVHQASDLKDKGIKVICMDPGWVKTDMGGDAAALEPEESITGMLKVLHGLKADDSGHFFRHDGAQVPW